MAATTKSILTVSTLAMAAMFGGGVYLFMNLNTLAKPRIEKIASQTLGVPVAIGSMDVVLQEKRVSASNIRIANPKGFSRPHAITIDGASVKLGSIGENLITLDSIVMNGTTAYLEVKESGTNLSALQKGMAPPDPNSLASKIKVIIKRFSMTKPTLNPAVTLITTQELEPVRIADVNVNGIGVKEGGVPAGQAVKVISQQVLKNAGNAASKAGFYQGLSAETLKEMGVGQVKALTDQIGKEIDKVTDSLKNIFN